MCKIREFILNMASKWDALPALLSRITIGIIFVQSGWGKFQHLENVVQFFASLGIPAPQLQAPFVAGVELICGGLVLAGLFTRMASIPLIGTMVVAIVTAKRSDVHAISDLFSLSEYLYIVLLLWLIVKGAGALSIDRYLARRCENPQAIGQ